MNKKVMMFAAIALVIGCKKDKEEQPVAPAPAPAQGNLLVTYGFHWEDNDFNLANTYADGAGNAIQFTAINFLVGETHIQYAGNVVANYHDSYALVTPEAEPTVTYGTVPGGSYDMLVVTIGLDSAENHSDPSTAEPPLNDTTMHWGPGTALGYYFFVMEGRVDDDGTGIVESDDPVFSYRCATDAALREAEIPISATVTSGNGLFEHVHIRVNLIVAGVDMLPPVTAIGYDAINVQLMDNLAGAMEIE